MEITFFSFEILFSRICVISVRWHNKMESNQLIIIQKE